ncbi:hypothetical protein BB558_005332 [Smittium angustum]|uniref:Nucleolar pre-ribosomal-associated protein 1 N-terminal domain-containing protein n=1 Tax=Smittium angustum TaxID=133377 RepID=A0A2U1J108_SMIAN|nr:hypothetical protein BB558_005332 [Smittium angustum]
MKIQKRDRDISSDLIDSSNKQSRKNSNLEKEETPKKLISLGKSNNNNQNTRKTVFEKDDDIVKAFSTSNLELILTNTDNLSQFLKSIISSLSSNGKDEYYENKMRIVHEWDQNTNHFDVIFTLWKSYQDGIDSKLNKKLIDVFLAILELFDTDLSRSSGIFILRRLVENCLDFIFKGYQVPNSLDPPTEKISKNPKIKEKNIKKGPFRFLWIQLVILLTRSSSVAIKEKLIDKGGIISGLLNNIIEDSYEDISYITRNIYELILLQPRIKRAHKTSFTFNVLVDQLVKLLLLDQKIELSKLNNYYLENTNESIFQNSSSEFSASSGEYDTIADFTLRFLQVILCKKGFLFSGFEFYNDPGKHSKSNFVKDSSVHDSSDINIHESAISENQDKALVQIHSSKDISINSNQLFRILTTKIKHTDSRRHTQLCVKILESYPSFIPSYWRKAKLYTEPKLSVQFLSAIAYSTKVMGLVNSVSEINSLFYGHQIIGSDLLKESLEVLGLPPQANDVIEYILPGSFNRLTLSKGLQFTSSGLVQYTTLNIIRFAMKKLNLFHELINDKLHTLQSCKKEYNTKQQIENLDNYILQWIQFRSKILQIMKRRLPEWSVVISVYRTYEGTSTNNDIKKDSEKENSNVLPISNTKNDFILEALLSVIAEYFKNYPEWILESRFDVGKLLKFKPKVISPSDNSSSASLPEKSTYQQGLHQLQLLHILKCVYSSPEGTISWNSSLKLTNDLNQNGYQIETNIGVVGFHYLTGKSETKILAKKILCKVLGNMGLGQKYHSQKLDSIISSDESLCDNIWIDALDLISNTNGVFKSSNKRAAQIVNFFEKFYSDSLKSLYRYIDLTSLWTTKNPENSGNSLDDHETSDALLTLFLDQWVSSFFNADVGCNLGSVSFLTDNLPNKTEKLDNSNSFSNSEATLESFLSFSSKNSANFLPLFWLREILSTMLISTQPRTQNVAKSFLADALYTVLSARLFKENDEKVTPIKSNNNGIAKKNFTDPEVWPKSYTEVACAFYNLMHPLMIEHNIKSKASANSTKLLNFLTKNKVKKENQIDFKDLAKTLYNHFFLKSNNRVDLPSQIESVSEDINFDFLNVDTTILEKLDQVYAFVISSGPEGPIKLMDILLEIYNHDSNQKNEYMSFLITTLYFGYLRIQYSCDKVISALFNKKAPVSLRMLKIFSETILSKLTFSSKTKKSNLSNIEHWMLSYAFSKPQLTVLWDKRSILRLYLNQMHSVVYYENQSGHETLTNISIAYDLLYISSVASCKYIEYGAESRFEKSEYTQLNINSLHLAGLEWIYKDILDFLSLEYPIDTIHEYLNYCISILCVRFSRYLGVNYYKNKTGSWEKLAIYASKAFDALRNNDTKLAKTSDVFVLLQLLSNLIDPGCYKTIAKGLYNIFSLRNSELQDCDGTNNLILALLQKTISKTANEILSSETELRTDVVKAIVLMWESILSRFSIIEQGFDNFEKMSSINSGIFSEKKFKILINIIIKITAAFYTSDIDYKLFCSVYDNNNSNQSPFNIFNCENQNIKTLKLNSNTVAFTKNLNSTEGLTFGNVLHESLQETNYKNKGSKVDLYYTKLIDIAPTIFRLAVSCKEDTQLYSEFILLLELLARSSKKVREYLCKLLPLLEYDTLDNTISKEKTKSIQKSVIISSFCVLSSICSISEDGRVEISINTRMDNLQQEKDFSNLHKQKIALHQQGGLELELAFLNNCGRYLVDSENSIKNTVFGDSESLGKYHSDQKFEIMNYDSKLGLFVVEFWVQKFANEIQLQNLVGHMENLVKQLKVQLSADKSPNYYLDLAAHTHKIVKIISSVIYGFIRIGNNNSGLIEGLPKTTMIILELIYQISGFIIEERNRDQDINQDNKSQSIHGHNEDSFVQKNSSNFHLGDIDSTGYISEFNNILESLLGVLGRSIEFADLNREKVSFLAFFSPEKLEQFVFYFKNIISLVSCDSREEKPSSSHTDSDLLLKLASYTTFIYSKTLLTIVSETEDQNKLMAICPDIDRVDLILQLKNLLVEMLKNPYFLDHVYQNSRDYIVSFLSSTWALIKTLSVSGETSYILPADLIRVLFASCEGTSSITDITLIGLLNTYEHYTEISVKPASLFFGKISSIQMAKEQLSNIHYGYDSIFGMKNSKILKDSTPDEVNKCLRNLKPKKLLKTVYFFHYLQNSYESRCNKQTANPRFKLDQIGKLLDSCKLLIRIPRSSENSSSLNSYTAILNQPGLSSCYNPEFILNLFVALLSADSDLDIRYFIRINGLALAFAATSSSDVNIRSVGYLIIAKTLILLRKSPKFNEKYQLLCLLGMVKNSVEYENMRIPYVITLFLSGIISFIFNPGHPIYPVASQLMLQSPQFNLKSLPSFFGVVFSGSSLPVSFRNFMLHMASYGSSCYYADRLVFQKTFVFEQLFSFALTPLTGNSSFSTYNPLLTLFGLTSRQNSVALHHALFSRDGLLFPWIRQSLLASLSPISSLDSIQQSKSPLLISNLNNVLSISRLILRILANCPTSIVDKDQVSIPIEKHSSEQKLIANRGFYYCWVVNKQSDGGGGTIGTTFVLSSALYTLNSIAIFVENVNGSILGNRIDIFVQILAIVHTVLSTALLVTKAEILGSSKSQKRSSSFTQSQMFDIVYKSNFILTLLESLISVPQTNISQISGSDLTEEIVQSCSIETLNSTVDFVPKELKRLYQDTSNSGIFASYIYFYSASSIVHLDLLLLSVDSEKTVSKSIKKCFVETVSRVYKISPKSLERFVIN